MPRRIPNEALKPEIFIKIRALAKFRGNPKSEARKSNQISMGIGQFKNGRQSGCHGDGWFRSFSAREILDLFRSSDFGFRILARTVTGWCLVLDFQLLSFRIVLLTLTFMSDLLPLFPLQYVVLVPIVVLQVPIFEPL